MKNDGNGAGWVVVSVKASLVNLSFMWSNELVSGCKRYLELTFNGGCLWIFKDLDIYQSDVVWDNLFDFENKIILNIVSGSKDYQVVSMLVVGCQIDLYLDTRSWTFA